jgi:hypothetical protein
MDGEAHERFCQHPLLSSPQPSPQSASSLPIPLSTPSLLAPSLPKYLSSDGICGECYIGHGDIEGSLVHCGECPRSYHAPLIVNSTLAIETLSRSNACSVSYIQEVEVGAVFTCARWWVRYAHHAKTYLGVILSRARAFRIYRDIAGGETFKIRVFKWTLF